jgi:hypothetical protein
VFGIALSRNLRTQVGSFLWGRVVLFLHPQVPSSIGLRPEPGPTHNSMSKGEPSPSAGNLVRSGWIARVNCWSEDGAGYFAATRSHDRSRNGNSAGEGGSGPKIQRLWA